jgi:hemolysin activation/secretion protein
VRDSLRRIYHLNHLTALVGVLFFLLTANLVHGQAPGVRSEVKKIVVEGENPLTVFQTRKILDAYLGEYEGISHLEEAAKGLENELIDKGHAFYRVIVPPQRVVDHIVKLKIIKFSLDQIDVEGNKHFSKENILASIPSLQKGATPNTNDIARSIQVANQHPAKQVAVFVRESAHPERIDARVETQDVRPYQFFTNLNNTGTSNPGRLRLSVGAQHNNLFDCDHSLTLNYTTSPENVSDVRQYGISYRLPIYSLYSHLSLFYIYSEMDQGLVGDFFDVSGRGTFSGINLDYTLSPIAAYNHHLSLGFQDRMFEDNSTFNSVLFGADVRSTPLIVRYNGRFEKRWGTGGIYVEYAQNLGIGSHNNDASYTAVRAGADKAWEVYRYGANIDLNLPQSWSLKFNFSGQKTHEPLIPGEQFGTGGVRSVRGYEEREVAGENGQQFNVELWTPTFGYNTRCLLFADGGRIKREPPHTGYEDAETMASAGVGIRWHWKSYLNVSVDFARAFKDSTVTRAHHYKLHFNIFVRF